MIVELQVENLALIRSARLPLGSGLCALTGETGAGKSLVLRALDVLRGARLSREHLRDGASECRVRALFLLTEEKGREIRQAVPGVALDDGEFAMSRVIGRDGRSRSYIDERVVSLSTLREVSVRLFDVLGQNEASRLRDAAHRAAILDRFGGLDREVAAWSAARERARASTGRRESLERDADERARRLDYLLYLKREIDALDPRPGEISDIEAELQVLAEVESLKDLCGTAIQRLYEGDDSAYDVLAGLVRRAESLGKACRQRLAGALAALERAAAEIEDATAHFREIHERTEDDPRRRAELSERQGAILALLDRLRIREEELPSERRRIGDEVARLERDEHSLESADRDVEKALAELTNAGRRLVRARASAAKRLAKAVEEDLRRLGMPDAAFAIEQTEHPGEDALARAHATGPARVDFMLRANKGLDPRPIDQVMSGGEAARIALALHAATSAAGGVPVVVFDEVESGVGARLGEALAQALRSIAGHRQVLCVTHLAPIAAYADRHLRVRKVARGGAAETVVEVMEGEAREEEIAAMLRGDQAGAATRRDARSLLENARGAAG